MGTLGEHSVLLGMPLEVAVVEVERSSVRGRLGLLSQHSAPLIKRDLNEDS